MESFSSRGSRGFLQISAHEIAKSEMSQQFQVANMTNDRYAVLSAWRETLSTYIQYMKHRPGSTVVVEMAMSRRGELAAERNDESCRTEMAWVEVAAGVDAAAVLAMAVIIDEDHDESDAADREQQRRQEEKREEGGGFWPFS